MITSLTMLEKVEELLLRARMKVMWYGTVFFEQNYYFFLVLFFC
jgi:hypothetical protein